MANAEAKLAGMEKSAGAGKRKAATDTTKPASTVVSLMQGPYGVKQLPGVVFLYNKANHRLHPWTANRFRLGEQGFRSLEQWYGLEKVDHFKLGEDVKAGVLACRGGWDVVSLLRDKLTTIEGAAWKGWGARVAAKLPQVLLAMAKHNPGFVKVLMAIKEPVIGFCTPDRLLGTGVDLEGGADWELFDPNVWEGRNLLGEELVRLREQLREGQLPELWEVVPPNAPPEWQEPEAGYYNDEIEATGAGSQIPLERQGEAGVGDSTAKRTRKGRGK